MPLFDAVTSAKIDANIAITFEHTTASLPNRFMIVTLMTGEGAVAGGPDSCTYNGVALTEAKYQQVPVSGQGVYIFTLDDPAVGAHDVVIDIDARHGNTTIQATARTYSGCSGHRTLYGANGADDAPTVTVVDSVANDLVIDVVGNTKNNSNPPDTATVGAAQTQRSNHTQVSAAKEARESTSEETATGGNTVMSWTLGAANKWAIAATALKPALAGSQAFFIG